MRQWIGLALVQIMACRLFGAKPLSKPILGYYSFSRCQRCRGRLVPRWSAWAIINCTLMNKLQGNFNQNKKLFIHGNAYENIVWEMTVILSWEDELTPDFAASILREIPKITRSPWISWCCCDLGQQSFVQLVYCLLDLVLRTSRQLGPLYWYGLTLIPAWISNYTHYNTETEMSFWRNFHQWLLWNLSFWQLSMQPVIETSSKWRHFRFNESVGWNHLSLLKLQRCSRWSSGSNE